MATRLTIDIPESLYRKLQNQSECSATSIPSLILRAVAERYDKSDKKQVVTRPLVRGSGKLGPQFPKNENPHDLVFSDLNLSLIRP